MTDEELICAALDDVSWGMTAWEGDGNVVTLNGEIVGGTVRNPEFNRWWVPNTRKKLAAFIAEHMRQT